jgi:hypothetical protein
MAEVGCGFLIGIMYTGVYSIYGDSGQKYRNYRWVH